MDSKFALSIKKHWGKMLMMCAALVMALYLDGPSDAAEKEGVEGCLLSRHTLFLCTQLSSPLAFAFKALLRCHPRVLFF